MSKIQAECGCGASLSADDATGIAESIWKRIDKWLATHAEHRSETGFTRTRNLTTITTPNPDLLTSTQSSSEQER